MWRKLIWASIVLLVIATITVRITYHELGWGGYWAVDFVAPWDR